MKYRLALVTGASSGIGESLCHLLASKGVDLIITGRNEKKLNEISALLRPQVKVGVIALDLAVEVQRKALIEQIKQLKPDLVINNAGIGLYGEVLSHKTNDQMDILKINGEALLEITIEAAKTLFAARKHGTILNVSSAAAYFIFPTFSVYSASKTFVKEVSESLDYEMKPYGIRVLVSCPGQVETDFKHRAAQGNERTAEDYSSKVMSPMTSEYAAKEIWKQIEDGKTVHVFDWRYRVLIVLSKLIPKSLLSKMLLRHIEKRHN